MIEVQPDVVCCVTRQVQALLDAVQEQRYDLLFEQHQLVVVAACIYAITRVLPYARSH